MKIAPRVHFNIYGKRVVANSSFSSDQSFYTLCNGYKSGSKKVAAGPKISLHSRRDCPQRPPKFTHQISTAIQVRFQTMVSLDLRRRKSEKASGGVREFIEKSFLGEINQRMAQVEVLDAPPSWAGASYVDIRGSCNGLLLMGIDDNLYLWNPSIRWYSRISSSYGLYGEYYVAIAGLCFDSTRTEYKAVLARKHRIPGNESQDIQVHSLKNKFWKKIEDFPYDVGSGQPGPSMNDRLHWVVSTKVGYSHFCAPQFVVYFDAKTEKFEKFPMPDVSKGKEGNPILGLGVLDGCLCMVLCEENARYGGPVQVLSMKEYGVKESWTILFRIKDIKYGQELVPLFYTGKGNTVNIMKVTSRSYDDDCFVRAYNTNDDASFILPLLECDDAIVYEETFAYQHDEEDYQAKKVLDRHKRNF